MIEQNLLTAADMPDSTHWILAFYYFAPIEDPEGEVKTHKKFFTDRQVTCRIYISEEGINGQMSATKEDAKAYIEWMVQRPEFSNIKFKIHPYHEQVFPRITVKYRKKLVAIDTQYDLSKQGEHVSRSAGKQCSKQMLIKS